MISRAAGFACVVVLAAGMPAMAEEPGRYVLVPAGEAFLRLDTATGAVSLCGRRSIGWGCEAVPDDRPAVAASGDQTGVTADQSELRDRLTRAEDELASQRAANAELSARVQAAEAMARQAKADVDQHAATGADPRPEAHAIEPSAPGATTPERAGEDVSAFVERLIRRLHQMARDLQRDDQERAL